MGCCGGMLWDGTCFWARSERLKLAEVQRWQRQKCIYPPHVLPSPGTTKSQCRCGHHQEPPKYLIWVVSDAGSPQKQTWQLTLSPGHCPLPASETQECRGVSCGAPRHLRDLGASGLCETTTSLNINEQLICNIVQLLNGLLKISMQICVLLGLLLCL